jgi:hypothetical protein
MSEYTDNQPIEELVHDTATAAGRGADKANEWLAVLKEQDIMTVGDLRDLQHDDWPSLYFCLTQRADCLLLACAQECSLRKAVKALRRLTELFNTPYIKILCNNSFDSLLECRQ